MTWFNTEKFRFLQSSLLKNSIWGLVANILQTMFVSLFFICVARNYSDTDFAQFLMASTVYQILVAFSSLGLGQWFTREFVQSDNKRFFARVFIKTQCMLGVGFYVINLVVAELVYPNSQIGSLCIILGLNIIFDNLFYALRTINVAEGKQKNTIAISVFDGFIKVVLGGLVFIFPLSIILLSSILVFFRFITVNLFLRISFGERLSFREFLVVPVSIRQLANQVISNWQFVIIGSVSVIYWRLGNIFIARELLLIDVSKYEISFRIFSIFIILPTIVSATVFPKLVHYFKMNDFNGSASFYQQLSVFYNVFALISYAFIYSFGEIVLVYAFGDRYADVGDCLKQMFLTILLFPTVILQANVIISIKLERWDMICNAVSLFCNILGCFVGLYFFKSLAVVNYSIFVSFLIFHLFQNLILIKYQITTLSRSLLFYAILILFIFAYHISCYHYSPYLTFLIFCSALLLFINYIVRRSEGDLLKLKVF